MAPTLIFPFGRSSARSSPGRLLPQGFIRGAVDGGRQNLEGKIQQAIRPADVLGALLDVDPNKLERVGVADAAALKAKADNFANVLDPPSADREPAENVGRPRVPGLLQFDKLTPAEAEKPFLPGE